uniref:Syne1_3 protein n=1 Tax=Fopius arisanus TaxID=64838 RepID=A0A0C9R3P1_9HYME
MMMIMKSKSQKKTLNRTTRSVQKSQSSLMTIFLNGLRKIGIIAPSESEKNPEKGCQNPLAKGNTLFTCFSPVVPVVETSRTPRGVTANVREPVHDSLVYPEEDSDPRKIMQCVNINVVLSRSSQSTQTEDDYLSALESTRASQTHRIHVAPAVAPKSSDVGIQADPLMTEVRTAFPSSTSSSQANSLITDESSTSSVAPPAKSLSSVIQNFTDDRASKISEQGIRKPPRARPPKKIITEAIIHQDASLSSNRIPMLSRSKSAGAFEIRSTPTGRFSYVPLSQNHSFMRCSSSTLEPPSATTYPLQLPAPKSSRIQECRQSEKMLSDSSSLAGRILRSCKSFQIAKSNSGRESKTMGAQTYSSDHLTRTRRIYLAEASRPSVMTQDLENEIRTEEYSNSEVMSSTRVLNASTGSPSQNDPKRPQEFLKKPTEFPHDLAHGDNQEETIEKRWNRCMDHIIRNTNTLLERYKSLASNDSENIFNECPEMPSKPPEVLLCHNPTGSKTTISDFQTNFRDLSKEKRGIADRLRDFFRRRGKRKYQSVFQESDTTFERPLRWNLMRPQQSNSL